MKYKEVIAYIVQWLKKYAEESGSNGFVIGISGGIDSAVTSTLCAMTGKQVIALNMPIHQHKAEYDRAQEHIMWLGAKFANVMSQRISLTATFECISESFPGEIRDALTMANTRARLRMTTLYAYASHYRLLVAGTGNKVEDFGVGFFTKYGDGGVDLSPIADLMKSEVFAIAKELDIVKSIQVAKPTDGLWADEKSDEDQIGATYDELEWAMNTIAKLDEATLFTNLTAREKLVLDIYIARNRANRHKMVPIPVCTIPSELK